MDAVIRGLIADAIVSACGACKNVPLPLERFAPSERRATVRGQMTAWAATLRDAAETRMMTEALGDDDFRFRTDIADALCGASEVLGARAPNLPPMILRLLSLVVVLSAHVRLQRQASIRTTEHDQEAVVLLRHVNEQIQATGWQINRAGQAAKRRVCEEIGRWLQESPESYDQRLAPSMFFVARNLPA
ncbi:MAG: hypothetical protein U0136_14025 [Bdellovibrionota bacterium]